MKLKQTKSEWNNRDPIKFLNEKDFNEVKSKLTIYDGKTIAEDDLKKNKESSNCQSTKGRENCPE